jgi:trimeric autotransporter adhesin
VVDDAGTNSPWSGTEVFGANAEDTSTVTGDVTPTAGGSLTYELFTGATCNGTQLASQTVSLNLDGSVPNSDPTSSLDGGTYSYDAIYNGDGSNDAAPGICESFTILQATPSPTPSISNLPSSPTWSSGGGFTAVLNATDSDGVQSVTSSTTGVCSASGLVVTYVSAGQCTLTAQTAASTNYLAASGSQQSFTIVQATPSPTPAIANLPSSPTWSSGGGFTAVLNATDSDGAQSVTSSTTGVCSASGLVVTYVTAGTCTLTAQTAQSTNYASASGIQQTFTIARATPSPAPSITNIPSSPTWSSGAGFTAILNLTNSDGAQSVSSSTTGVCTASGLVVTYVTAGMCTLTAQTAQGTDYAAASGTSQTFTISQATPAGPSITNIPSSPTWSPSGGFTAQLSTDSDGAQSVTSSTTSVCTTSGLVVTYVTAGTCTLTAQTAQSTNFAAASGAPQTFTIQQATPSPTPSISNPPSNPTWSSSSGFTAVLNSTDSDGVPSVSSSTPSVCTASGLVVTYVTAGTCTLTAQLAASTDYAAASGVAQTFTILQATPSPTPSISNLPSSPTWSSGGGFTAVLNATDSDGVQSVSSSTPNVCTANGLVVTYVTAGTCALSAQTAASTDYLGASGSQQSFTIIRATPTGPTVTNIPSNPVYQSTFTATVGTSSDGTTTVSSSTAGVCTVVGFTVSFVNVGNCTLTAHVQADTNYQAGDGSPQTFMVGLATPTTPVISNIPSGATEFAGFVASVSTNGDGATSVASISAAVCTVGSDGHTISFVGFGVCTLTASVAQGAHFFGATGNTQSFPVGPAARGYWLVGSDGGIFSFGAASFFGSMGSTPLQRPVVGITPSASRTGYWLVASDGGIFSFGSSSYYGSIPAVGLHPAGSGAPNSLNAPIVGMVPSVTGHGYFMVASDGGVFAFGDARFAGSCPGIGGCVGKAVAVMPDSTGKGYWLVTNTGNVYAFGDATFYGAPAPSTAPVVDAVATQDWRGYWLLYNNGVVASFGDATAMGAPAGYVNAFNPATSIFPTADGKGYWIASGRGDVFAYGDAPYLGSVAASGINGEIIAAFGF